MDRLPADVHVLYGGAPPTLYDDGRPIHATRMLGRGLSYARRVLTRLSWSEEQDHRLARLLQRLEVRVVLAEYGPIAVALMSACAEAHVPLVAHFHGRDAYASDVLDGPGRLYRGLFAQASAVVAVSRAMESQLVRLGAPANKVRYNPYGVDLSQFVPGRPEVNAVLFLAVGRFVDKKAPDLTLQAFRRVLDVVPDARLEMVGDGPLLETCQRLAKVLGIVREVSFAGVLAHQDVALRMQSARAFVQHSIAAASGDAEGTPVAVLEAQASGLPVVSTRHAGIPDVVVDRETGFLVDEEDVVSMADAMVRLAQDPKLAASMGRAGRQRIAAEFSMDKSINGLWDLLQSAMEAL